MASPLATGLNDSARIQDDSIHSNSPQSPESPKSRVDGNVSNSSMTRSRSTLIPIPSCCRGPKCETMWKTLKYIYVCIAFGGGLLILVLEQLVPSFESAVQDAQSMVIDFCMTNSLGILYLVLFIMLITFLKSVGISDVLSLRVMAVAILCWRLIPNSQGSSTLLCMLILGLLSSISHLLEYKLIGAELQDVQGKPIEIAFYWMRRVLLFCVRDEDRIRWVDPKWTLQLSQRTRHNEQLDLVTNLDRCLTPWLLQKCTLCCNSKTNTHHSSMYRDQSDVNGSDPAPPPRPPTHQDADAVDTKEPPQSVGCECSPQRMKIWAHLVWKGVLYLVAAIWAMGMEWIVPISEFLQYAHNWEFSISNAVVVVLSEMIDADRIFEIYQIVHYLQCCDDPIEGKKKSLSFKWVFYATGWLVLLPLTLIWYYHYHAKVCPPSVGSNLSVPVATLSTNCSSSILQQGPFTVSEEQHAAMVEEVEIEMKLSESPKVNGSSAITIETTNISKIRNDRQKSTAL